MAERTQVSSGKESPAQASGLTPARGNLLQRKCACGGGAGLTGACEECGAGRLELRRSAAGRAAATPVPPVVHEVLGSPGRPLDASTRLSMDRRFGHDFSRVRVHADSRAAESARAVNALAYTVGRDVVFDTGRYAPETREGQKLLAHELAHTIQQGSVLRRSPDGLEVSDPSDASERAADAAADAVADGRPVSISAGGLPRLARQPQPGAPSTQAAPPCYDSDLCSKYIPGSAWDYSHKVGQAQGANEKRLKKDPALRKKVGFVRPAGEIQKFLNANAPDLMSGVTALIVNPAIMGTAGAQLTGCEVMKPRPPVRSPTCVEVPSALEDQARTYNTTAEPRVGSRTRKEWAANLLRSLTHEMAHIRFLAEPPTGIEVKNEVAMFELGELNSLLSEFPIVYNDMTSEPGADKAAVAKRLGDYYIDKPGEGIRGILMKMRCVSPCVEVAASVRAVFNSQTAGWPREMRDALLRELTARNRLLDWPMPAPVVIPKPPAPGVERPQPERPKMPPLYRPRGSFDVEEP